MEKVLMYFDARGFKDEVSSHSHLLPVLNEIYSVYSQMGFEDVTGEMFVKLVENTEEFLLDKKLSGKELQFLGMPIDKEKASELFIKNDAHKQLIELVTSLKRNLNWDYYLKLVEVTNGEVCLNKSFIEKIEERYKTHAVKERELKVLEFAKSIVEQANNLFKENVIGNFPLHHFIEEIINTQTGYHGSPSITPWTIKANGIKKVIAERSHTIKLNTNV